MSYERQWRDDALAAEVRYAREDVQRVTREVSHEERQQLEAARARHDSVAAHTGGPRASDPLPGESPIAYRRRLLKPLLDVHAKYKGSWLGACDSAVLGIIEGQVYKDAIDAARNNVPAGQLREIAQRDAAGRLIKTYVGDPAVWLSPYMSKGAHVTLNRNPGPKSK